MKILFQIATSLTLAATAVAQTQNADQGPLRVDPETGAVVFQQDEQSRWKGSVNLGATFSSGNTNRRTANAAAQAIRRGDQDRTTLGADWNYADEKDQTRTRSISQRRTRGNAKYDYFLNEEQTTYVYGSISAENDKFSLLDLRLIVSAGVGYEILKEEDMRLNAEAGLAYFSEQRPGPDDEYLAARIAYHFEWDIQDGVQLIQDVEYIPGLESSDDAYVRKDTRLKVALSENMFSLFQWILDYDNTPATGLDRIDHLFLISIGWSFGATD